MQAKTALGRLIAFVSIAAAVVLIVVSMIVVDQRPRTHDAYIFAYSAGITPEVDGRIVAIHIRNDQFVHKGDVLLQIDPEPFELKLQQAKAQVAALQADINLTGRQVNAQGSGAEAAAREVDRARQQLALAHDTLAREQPLLAKGFVTTQQIDEARTNERTAASQLSAAIQQAAQAKEAVGDVESLKAQLLGAQAVEALAARDLRETVIRATVDGRVTGFNLALGSFAVSGHPLFTLIDDNSWYAVANFRETDLRGMHTGDAAQIWVMGHEGQPLHGVVESLGAGVQPEGAAGPGLPQVDRNLNWVVVAQRFPVWVRLDQPSQPFLRIGATASVRVSHARTD
ncbi:HlyD family efflux transporter periplasmic adaptor subunit [Dyella nitratireducens]|uniref:Multidrug resistance protein MdtN n=1 Tax=Dyella nitratireducens TaxID=1849580 RepID=A0ABQ1GEU8_9GAMM|nr:HlyD family efflux transporter periplasmic adaptor subunit [Dyella nitratireducens]GGA42193.1 multidrug resistance protein MdtN [Dyella nitratireducens]GLQ42038.1 multidrug resistance protein MdtN [Dyella nitratireducens]